jgi:hypothetical protein
MLPMIESTRPNASCAMIHLGELKYLYDKNFIDPTEYNEIKAVLTTKFFAE